MRRIALLSFPAVLLASLSGCATIFEGTKQQVTIDSNVRGAEVLLNGSRIGTTPFSGEIPRVGKPTLLVRAPGYVPKKAYLHTETPGTFYLQFFLMMAGLPFTTTDMVSGAWIRYAPNSYVVELQPNVDAYPQPYPGPAVPGFQPPPDSEWAPGGYVPPATPTPPPQPQPSPTSPTVPPPTAH
jgi:hypothetical protein